GPMREQVQGLMGAPSSAGRAKRRKEWRPPKVLIRGNANTTRWEESFARHMKKELDAQPLDRTRRMRLVRAQVRARQYKDARRVVQQWLDDEPWDAEAWVQHAQLEAYSGDTDGAMAALLN